VSAFSSTPLVLCSPVHACVDAELLFPPVSCAAPQYLYNRDGNGQQVHFDGHQHAVGSPLRTSGAGPSHTAAAHAPQQQSEEDAREEVELGRVRDCVQRVQAVVGEDTFSLSALRDAVRAADFDANRAVEFLLSASTADSSAAACASGAGELAFAMDDDEAVAGQQAPPAAGPSAGGLPPGFGGR
jgi:hypothetical protein